MNLQLTEFSQWEETENYSCKKSIINFRKKSFSKHTRERERRDEILEHFREICMESAFSCSLIFAWSGKSTIDNGGLARKCYRDDVWTTITRILIGVWTIKQLIGREISDIFDGDNSRGTVTPTFKAVYTFQLKIPSTFYSPTNVHPSIHIFFNENNSNSSE